MRVRILGILVALAVMGSIWVPLVAQYRVATPVITAPVIERSRGEPAGAVWSRVRGDRLLGHGWSRKADVVSAAEDLLKGELRLAPSGTVRFRFPFTPEDLSLGSPALQLQVAGLVPADLLLAAYDLTGDEKFFRSAQRLLLDFVRYERRARIPKGLLWNDHAIANRVFVLSDFWRRYRGRADFRPEVATVVLDAAARAAAFLADPGQFTFSSNHGIMQNVGLLRFAVAFPALPGAERYRRVAVERLAEQMAFYIADDGVVLEHSAAYQFFGIQLVQMVIRYMTVLGVPVPEDWRTKYRRAQEFAAQLRRPDGTLPVFGDTRWGVGGAPISGAAPHRPVTWYPDGGYAVWWDGDRTQTVATSSYFPGHAHKHADDLSVLLWSAGQTWWTNVGFWPYGAPERARAVSWGGSNAPHLRGEAPESIRTTGLLSLGAAPSAAFVEARRRGPGTYEVRRQTIHLRPDTWIILDAVSGAPGKVSTTTWLPGYGIDVRAEGGGRYVLAAGASSSTLRVSISGSRGVSARLLPRTLGPFRRAREQGGPMVPAIEVAQPGDRSWVVSTWRLESAARSTPSAAEEPPMIDWSGPTHWTLALPFAPAPRTIVRRGDRLVVASGQTQDALTLSGVPTDRVTAIGEAFARSAARYPQFHDRLRARRFSTYALLVVLGMQEAVFSIVHRRGSRRTAAARGTAMVLWILGGVALAAWLRWSS